MTMLCDDREGTCNVMTVTELWHTRMYSVFTITMYASCSFLAIWLVIWAGNIFICPSSDGTYYGIVMSVRPAIHPSIRPDLRPSVTVFPHFSPTCFDILSQSSSSVVNFRQFFLELCPFCNLKYWKYSPPPPPPPWGPGGLSRECATPYPQRDRNRRLNGAVCRNHRIKRVVPCRC